MVVVDDVVVAGGGDEDIGLVGGILHRDHFVAFHRRLQGADRVDFGHPDLGAERAQSLGRTLSDVAVASHDCDLAGDHNVGGSLDAIDERFAATVQVIELALGHRVVHVEAWEWQFALLLELIEPVDAGGGLFADSLDVRLDSAVEGGVHGELGLDRVEQADFFFALGVVQDARIGFGLASKQDEHCGVAAVVQDHVRRAAVAPLQDLVGESPVFIERLAFVGKDRGARLSDRRRCVVLGAVDVAARPANLGSELDQRLDENGGLDRHVERTSDSGALERLARLVFVSDRHEAGHFGLGDGDLFSAPISQAQVSDMKVSFDEVFGDTH